MAGNQYYRTPDIFFNALERKFGKFDLDVAADEGSTKCFHWVDENDDALKFPWGGKYHSKWTYSNQADPFKNIFCNPPWKNPRPWIRQAVEFTCGCYDGHNHIKDRQAIILLHTAFCAKKWWGWVQEWADEVVIPTHERVEFIDPLTKDKKSGNMRDNMILVFRYREEPRKQTEILPVSFWDWNNNGGS